VLQYSKAFKRKMVQRLSGPGGWKCTVAGTPGTWITIPGVAVAHGNSTATTVAEVNIQYNALLAKLRAAGIIVP
jgi:hypothetical protein